MIKKIARMLRTLRYLTPRQLAFFILRRKLPAKTVTLVANAEMRLGASLDPLLPYKSFEADEQEFSFLNQSMSYEDRDIDWSPQQYSRLWRYHLHYFDALRDIERTPENKKAIIDHWVEHNPQGSTPGWEPYTASLRVVNWVSFFFRQLAEGSELPRAWLQNLYTQALWLECNDERHILANHYFENIKALLFAGVLFQGGEADRWLRKGQQLLLEQLHEQMLADGGHYERSPHYHCLMLENYLDLISLVKSNADLFEGDVQPLLVKTARSGLDLLASIIKPDGSIPLFNDSVYGAAPTFKVLATYAEGLFDYQLPQVESGLAVIEHPDTGLFGFKTAEDYLVIDCGDVGPAYQPGHTHCDFLSFELMLDNQPVVVDSGLYEYAPGEMRHYVRTTAAHNTIAVDGQEQSEIWGEFRVARRAKKLSSQIALADQQIEFMGEYEGFPAIPGKVAHRRELSVDNPLNNPVVSIVDRVQGKGKHEITSYLHFHPDLVLTAESGSIFVVSRDSKAVCRVTVDESMVCSLEESWYCPEFGLRYKNPVLVMRLTGVLPIEQGYQIEKL